MTGLGVVVSLLAFGMALVATIAGVVWRFAVVAERQRSEAVVLDKLIERIDRLEEKHERFKSTFPDRIDKAMRRSGGDVG